MKKIFVNLSNHSSKDWSIEQKAATRAEIHDWTFPQIDPTTTADRVKKMAKEFVRDIIGSYHDATEITVHVMGESTFVYNFVTYAKLKGLRCVASTTERGEVKEITKSDGTKVKVSTFKFIQFREY